MWKILLFVTISLSPLKPGGLVLPMEDLNPLESISPAKPTIERTAIIVPIVKSTNATGQRRDTTSSTSTDSTCYRVPVSQNTPTGIAGCERWGRGIASYYSSGGGVAMNFCTWVYRHTHGCGYVTITSTDTGASVTVPVIDFCDCYTGTSDERIVDLQMGVLDALGLNASRGLYRVKVWPVR